MHQVQAGNKLLAALPGREYQRLSARLEHVTLTLGEILYEPQRRMRYVYFPSGALVSLITLVKGPRALEIGLVGSEGMLGIPLALGIDDAPLRARVQETGAALRMASAHFRGEYEKRGVLHTTLNRYIHESFVQLTQSAACNRFHTVEGRLARRLLMTRDRTGTNQVHLTQELLGTMLGVLRVAVTHAAGALQRRKLIGYRRGEIDILDDLGLEAAACPCYRVAKSGIDSARALRR